MPLPIMTIGSFFDMAVSMMAIPQAADSGAVSGTMLFESVEMVCTALSKISVSKRTRSPSSLMKAARMSYC